MNDPKNLDRWSEKLFDVCKRAAASRSNESGLIADIDPVIREALVDLYGFTPESMDAEYETLVNRAGHSPVDRIYASVLVEYEFSMGEARKRHGSDQALTYLRNLEKSTGVTERFTAVVTDGQSWGFMVDRPEEVPTLFSAPDRAPEEYFEWRNNSIASCRRFLQICGSHDKRPLSGQALALAFGPNQDAVGRFVAVLAATLEGRSAGDRTDTLLKEWDRSTEIVYGSLDTVDEDVASSLRTTFSVPRGYCDEFPELLFVVHTYFAVVARLIAVEVLAIAWGDVESQPSHWGSLADDKLAEQVRALDNGTLPAGAETVQNLFESDVFSWWVDHLTEETLEGLRGLVNILDSFAFPKVAFGVTPPTDVLRDLYMRLVPRELRRKLGEYPTPFWLAEACLADLAELGAPLRGGRVLDPCCGTGAFLLPILRSRVTELRVSKGEAATQEDVQELLDGIVGMDINPIAVIATRVNMLVTLGSFAELGGFRLPIWRTDSISVPDTTPGQRDMDDTRLAGADYLELRTSVDDPFPIPRMLSHAAGVAEIRAGLEDALTRSDRDTALGMFQQRISDGFGPDGRAPVTDNDRDWAETTTILSVLLERVQKLADDGRDGVWARIIENSFAPLFIGQFDVVVGNPPWLGWPYMPDRWRSDVEPLWRKYGLWKLPRSPGEPQRTRAQFNDIATLVFAKALDQYCQPNGWVGFLTPEALITADPGARAFRKFRLRSDTDPPAVDIEFAVAYCGNWAAIKPFGSQAANKPIFLVARRDKAHSFPVPTTRWTRREAGSHLSEHWAETKLLLKPTQGLSRPADPNATFSAWSFSTGSQQLMTGGRNTWTFGMGFNTRGAAGIFHVDVDRPDIPGGTVRIANRPTDGRKREVSRYQSTVESAMVAPMLRGRDIKPWIAVPSGFIVTTQDPNKLSSLLTESEFSRRYPKTLSWLRRFRPILEKRSTPNSSWDMTGTDWYRIEGPWPHADGPYLVVLPEQKLPPPVAIIEAGKVHGDLGRRAMPIPNHKVVFCAVPTLREAAYLAAVLNSPPVQAFLASYGSATAVAPTTLSRLAIPPFKNTGPEAEIADIGVAIHSAADPTAEAEKRAERLGKLVTSLLDAPPTKPPEKKRLTRRKAKEPSLDEHFLF